MRATAALLEEVEAQGEALPEGHLRYLRDVGARQVRFAHARLERDRSSAIEILTRLFNLGRPPQPDGHYEGELVALSTGLLADPFFEWLTRIYQPWIGKTFDIETNSGDNVFLDRAMSKATGKLGWPGYRVREDGVIRVFPFSSSVGPGLEDPELQVLSLNYSDGGNPLPVRRMKEELIELPGGYILGKSHMRGLRELRRVCFFGLYRPGQHEDSAPA